MTEVDYLFLAGNRHFVSISSKNFIRSFPSLYDEDKDLDLTGEGLCSTHAGANRDHPFPEPFPYGVLP